MVVTGQVQWWYNDMMIIYNMGMVIPDQILQIGVPAPFGKVCKLSFQIKIGKFLCQFIVCECLCKSQLSCWMFFCKICKVLLRIIISQFCKLSFWICRFAFGTFFCEICKLLLRIIFCWKMNRGYQNSIVSGNIRSDF